VALLLVAAVPAAADSGSTPPAGGSAIGQVIGATLGAGVVTAALLALVAGHRSGRVRVLARVAGACSRATGLAEWAALPILLLVGVSLLVAVFGMYGNLRGSDTLAVTTRNAVGVNLCTAGSDPCR
jgi:hypothetical protein